MASSVAAGGLRGTVALPVALTQLPVAANQPKARLPTNTMGAIHGSGSIATISATLGTAS